MNKRFFFVSYVLSYEGMFSDKRLYNNALIDTENGKYIQLHNMEESLLEGHRAVLDLSDNASVKILNVVELDEEDYDEMSNK